MNVVLIILLVLAMLGALTALVRGIITFLKTTEADLRSDAAGPSASGLKQNRMMMHRIMFQGVAVIFAVLLLILAGNQN